MFLYFYFYFFTDRFKKFCDFSSYPFLSPGPHGMVDPFNESVIGTGYLSVNWKNKKNT